MSLFAGSLTTGKLFNGGLFNGALFATSIPFPGSLFSGGYVGAWLDINDLSLIYTTDTGSTNVTAVSDSIGRAVTKSGGTVNALQDTASLRPILGQWPSGGRYYAYHDRVDDNLTLAGMPAGTYTIGAASFSGVSIYEHVYSAGTISLPAINYSELIVINRSLTVGEKSGLQSYLANKTPVIGATDILRLFCSSSSVNLSVTASGSSSSFTWELGDGQTEIGYSCVKTISAPQSVVFRGTLPETVTSFSIGTKTLYGQIIDLSKLSALTTFYCYLNQLTGSIPSLSANTALTQFICYDNQLTGSIPSLSANTALTTFYCYLNQLTGSIPSLSANTALTQFRCDINQLTGSIPSLSANTALTQFRCNDNQITGSIPSLSANTALTTFYCNTNQLTGSIPSLSANTALTQFRCNTNQLTGSIPSLSANTALTQFYCNTNQLTDYVGGAFPASLGTFNASSNPLTASAVNAILAGAVAGGRTSASGTCVMTLNGTGPAAPTGQGITDKATLISRGWTVSTN